MGHDRALLRVRDLRSHSGSRVRLSGCSDWPADHYPGSSNGNRRVLQSSYNFDQDKQRVPNDDSNALDHGLAACADIPRIQLDAARDFVHLRERNKKLNSNFQLPSDLMASI